ncbi:quinone oxidoreductase-like protein 2 isoform X5 [Neofelis nebulosa]|uniref:quinone oxidoreductase-like protein 2 isoform X5 n=1 Tax=Neofelis nebulosa TaxID=61452 RepID=UPI00272B05C4|nr:quinone oxidoreductase-like protein 2 isoform X5 [Neofelis nebulosa]
MIYCFYCFLSSPAGSTTREPGALGARTPRGPRTPLRHLGTHGAPRVGWPRGGPGAVPATGVSRVGRSRAIPGARAGPALSRASCHPGPPLRASPLRAMAAVAWGRCLPRVWLRRRAGPGCGRHYRAALCAELKQPLAIEEVASRPVRPHEVRVDVHFCGVNFADILVCRGQYQEKPQLPFTPGMEFSGTVLETGTDVSTVKEGDRVIGVSGFNGMAEECIIDHKVIAAAGSDEKCRLAMRKGAQSIVNYSQGSLKEAVRKLVGSDGVNVVIDAVGGDVFLEAVRSLAWEGRIVVVGFAGGTIASVPANLLLLKNVSAMGLYWGRYKEQNFPVFSRILSSALQYCQQGRIQPHIGAVFKLEEVNDAFLHVIQRKSMGKLRQRPQKICYVASEEK